ncbi:radical SAM protein [Streptomyces sp. NBC_01275]|uniref:radical SAM protein n=1 Tax=Streptomyces sp. NBC_01275 TaxID=2903807 RepID=UPI00225ACD43|nr:radical SAM protein [Streptomyces sp. NBC_01275]MCX4765856.1 radical SAM protein [Streptomyces sp. NBC_01275]
MNSRPTPADTEAARNRPTLADTEAMRRRRGESVLLYITDQCPVGCAHCSVDARADGGRVADWEAFHDVVAGIVALPGLRSVAVSGGEPFAEQRALPYAIGAFADAGLDTVVFTSGYWARENGSAPGWVRRLLPRISTLFLSTDGFHQGGVSNHRFVGALRAAHRAGCRIVVQELDTGDGARAAEGLLLEALGPRWADEAETKLITPLRYGRGSGVFALQSRHEVGALAACTLLGSPTVRYDGVVIPCCNEGLITGHGPSALRAPTRRPEGVARALTGFRNDPLLRVVGRLGPGAAADLPGFEALREERFENVCGGCWKAYDIAGRPGRAADSVTALGVALREGG